MKAVIDAKMFPDARAEEKGGEQSALRVDASQSAREPRFRSVRERGFELLVISQFTTLGVLKGNDPSFSRAMLPEPSRFMWSNLIRLFESRLEGKVKHTGRKCPFSYGNYSACKASWVNEGPMTIVLDSPLSKYARASMQSSDMQSSDSFSSDPQSIGGRLRELSRGMSRSGLAGTFVAARDEWAGGSKWKQQLKAQSTIEAVGAGAGGALAAVFMTVLWRWLSQAARDGRKRSRQVARFAESAKKGSRESRGAELPACL